MRQVLQDVFRSIGLAFSTFSLIPMPRIEWNERSARFMMAAFPLVGLVVGVLVWLWCLLCGALGVGTLLQGAGLVLIPVIVTGGIHLDGYCDVCDALASNAPPERRREILKDSHVGAFAVIGLGVYLVAAVALGGEIVLASRTPILLCAGYVLGRALSGLAVICFPKSASEGMAAFAAQTASKRPVVVALVVWAVLAIGVLLATDLLLGLAVACGMLFVWGLLGVIAKRCFDGMSGDLAGWFLCLAELALLACLALVGKVV